MGMNPIFREKKITLEPALCRHCHELVNVNKNAVLPKCPICTGQDVTLYSDPKLWQVRRKSVIKSRLVYNGTVPYEASKTDDTARTQLKDNDELDFLDLMDDEFETEDYIEGVDTTYYLCPKCDRFKTGENVLRVIRLMSAMLDRRG